MSAFPTTLFQSNDARIRLILDQIADFSPLRPQFPFSPGNQHFSRLSPNPNQRIKHQYRYFRPENSAYFLYFSGRTHRSGLFFGLGANIAFGSLCLQDGA